MTFIREGVETWRRGGVETLATLVRGGVETLTSFARQDE